jgi:hypothetical protein
MKTSTILFLVGSIVIIGGGALAFTMMTKPAADIAESTINQEVTVETTPSEAMTGSASILSLMSNIQDKSMECTFVFTDTKMRSEGTGFFIKGKSRVDMLYTDEKNLQVASYMIMDKALDSMYVWTLADGEQTGIKMSISENEKMAAQMSANTPGVDTTSKPEQISPETDVQYACKPWLPDTTVFIPPAGVAFTDMSEMTKMMGEMMNGMNIPTQ